MSSWPPTLVDWGTLTPRLRNGDHVCLVHGVVDPEHAPIGVPICPHCRQLISITRRDRDGKLRGFAEPAPTHCPGPERHPLIGGHVNVSWTPCMCPAASPGPGGHHIWTCSQCLVLGRDSDDAAHMWPPHSPDSR